MDRKIDGFTLIEILVAIAIIGVILGIAVPSYNQWQLEQQLNSATRKVHGFVQQERAKAYSTQQSITLSINGTKICDNLGNCIQTEHAFTVTTSTPPLGISGRGVFDSGNIRLKDDSLRKEYNPANSCIKLTDTRARLGRYDGSDCNVH